MKYTREGVLPRVLFTGVISFTLLAKCGSVSQQPFFISRVYRVIFFLVALSPWPVKPNQEKAISN